MLILSSVTKKISLHLAVLGCIVLIQAPKYCYIGTCYLSLQLNVTLTFLFLSTLLGIEPKHNRTKYSQLCHFNCTRITFNTLCLLCQRFILNMQIFLQSNSLTISVNRILTSIVVNLQMLIAAHVCMVTYILIIYIRL